MPQPSRPRGFPIPVPHPPPSQPGFTTLVMKQRLPAPASRCNPDHVEHLRIRNRLLALVRRQFDDLGYGQWHLAFILGVSQQRIADIYHARFERFNSETLIAMLERLGVEVDVVVSQRRRVNFHREWRRWAR